jgi:prephenate dehydrogenase
MSRDALLHRIVIVGGGSVGALLATNLTGAGAVVTVLDKAPQAMPGLPDGVVYLCADALNGLPDVAPAIRDADAVIIALPEQIALEALPTVTASMRERALLVDTLSVKSGIAEAVRRLAPPLEVFSINPMFGPSLGFGGHAVLAVEIAGGPLTAEMTRLLESWGADVVRCSVAEHDEATASVQVLTHAAIIGFGLALADLDGDIGLLMRAATPPFDVLVALLSRVSSGTGATYSEIQIEHPHAVRARDALRRGQERLAEAAEADSPEMLADALDEIRRIVAPENTVLESKAREVLRAVRHTG